MNRHSMFFENRRGKVPQKFLYSSINFFTANKIMFTSIDGHQDNAALDLWLICVPFKGGGKWRRKSAKSRGEKRWILGCRMRPLKCLCQSHNNTPYSNKSRRWHAAYYLCILITAGRRRRDRARKRRPQPERKRRGARPLQNEVQWPTGYKMDIG